MYSWLKRVTGKDRRRAQPFGGLCLRKLALLRLAKLLELQREFSSDDVFQDRVFAPAQVAQFMSHPANADIGHRWDYSVPVQHDRSDAAIRR